jgi:K+-transporting ATPase ATPase A chain
MPLALLGFAAASMFVSSIKDTTIANPGAHGLSEILYMYTSGANNNGSAFAGVTATQWTDVTMGIAMLIGRFFLIIPVLAIAGSMARKHASPPTLGTFPTHTPLFGGLVVGVVVIVAGLTFFPALALGPIVEQLSL